MVNLSRGEAVKPWINRGVSDLFVAFEQSDLLLLHLFFLHQGIEKLGKAYLIAAQADRYEHLDVGRATYKIESFARTYGHDLSDLIGVVGIGIPTLRQWLQDPVIDILEGAYLEGRYPRPPEASFIKRHGMPAVVSHRNQEKAFVISNEILEAFERDFGIVVPFEDALMNVHPDRIRRFIAILKKGKHETKEERIARNRSTIRGHIEQVVTASVRN